MKSKLISSLIALASLAIPLSVFAASIDSTLTVTGPYSTNTDSVFTANLNNFQAPSGGVGILSISDSKASDLKSAYFLDKSGWVKLTPYQSGSDVMAKFTSDTGFDVNGQRVVTMRVNFKTPKTYVVGFTLQTLEGKTLTSSASPLTVTGPKVLGAETPDPVVSGAVTGSFGRALKYGSSGADVTALQNKLSAEGVFAASATGFYGKVTQAAVKAYQTNHGISPANGVVGPQTLSVLNQ